MIGCTGTTIGCGRFFVEVKMPNFIDLTGQRFGKLTVLRKAENLKERVAWLCRCDCGNEKVIIAKLLRNGRKKNCGCVKPKRKLKHGDCNSRLYEIWKGINKRCNYKQYKQYNDYGGRGIRVCDEWKEYTAFREWALLNGYRDDLTIERIDNNSGYNPDNCRWIAKAEQSRNRRNVIIYNGLCVAEWARIKGISKNIIYQRIKKGLTISEAINTR